LSESVIATAALATGGNTAAVAEAMEANTRSAKSFRDHVLEYLGGAWPGDCPLDPRPRAAVERAGWRIESMQKDGYRIESIDYQVEPGDRVPALLLVPDGVDAAHLAPAVAVWQQHNGERHFGKSEPAGGSRRTCKWGSGPNWNPQMLKSRTGFSLLPFFRSAACPWLARTHLPV
jgi:hypothetical protein